MRIEDINEEVLTGLMDKDLYNLRLRAVQVFNKSFRDTAATAVGALTREDFLNRYSILAKEMSKRNLHPTWTDADKYLLRHKMMEGLDPALMGEILLESGCVVVGGEFARDPKGAEVCDVFITSGTVFSDTIERALNARITKQVGKPVEFHFGRDSVGETYLPLFDLKLCPRTTLEKIQQKIEKEPVEKDTGGECFYCACGYAMLRESDESPGQVSCPDCGDSVTDETPLWKVDPNEIVVSKPGFEETENEVRYRIRAPGQFQTGSFRRIALQRSRPRVYGIIGRLKGQTSTTLQALRFPKGDGWTIPKARAWVRAHPSVMKKNADLMKADVLEELMKFSHSSTTSPDAPSWGSVDKTKLPRIAFARMGDPDKVSTWGFPHHWIQGGGGADDNGRYTTGTMYLHEGGLNAAWAAAQGARAGAEAEAAVKSHLNAHRKALGRKEASAVGAGFTIQKVDKMEKIVGGIIYEPDIEDTQGDWTDAEQIRLAMYSFMENSQRVKVMHKGRAITAKILECYQSPVDFKVGKQTIKAGTWWLSVRVRDDAAWAAILAGELTGFSMGGVAREA